MSLQEFKDNVKNLIAIGKTKEAIKFMRKNLNAQNDVIMLSGSLYLAQRNSSINIISDEMYHRRLAQINNGILNFLDQINEGQIALNHEIEVQKIERIQPKIANTNGKLKNSFSLLIAIYSIVNKLNGRDPYGLSINEIEESGILVCEKVKQLLFELSNFETSISVQIVSYSTENDNHNVSTIWGDQNMEEFKELKDYKIHESPYNTILKEMLENENPYFISNDISCEKNENENTWKITNVDKFIQSEIPYESLIVAPICPANKIGENFTFLGFLKVISKSNCNLNDELEILILQSVAECLYPVLNSWIRKSTPNPFRDFYREL